MFIIGLAPCERCASITRVSRVCSALGSQLRQWRGQKLTLRRTFGSSMFRPATSFGAATVRHLCPLRSGSCLCTCTYKVARTGAAGSAATCKVARTGAAGSAATCKVAWMDTYLPNARTVHSIGILHQRPRPFWRQVRSPLRHRACSDRSVDSRCLHQSGGEASP